MEILVAYKGTNIGKELLDIAVMHAKAFNGNILLVTSMVGGEKMRTDKYLQAEERLNKAKQYIKDQGLESETHLLARGLEPGEDIVRFANEEDIDEIIIGIRSRSRVGKIIFGSSAQVVLLGAKCPVVAVK